MLLVKSVPHGTGKTPLLLAIEKAYRALPSLFGAHSAPRSGDLMRLQSARPPSFAQQTMNFTCSWMLDSIGSHATCEHEHAG